MSANAVRWVLRGRCTRLNDVTHMGGVVPARIVSEMRYDPKDIVPHLFAETDPGFHERCRPGDLIVTGRNFGMGPKMQGLHRHAGAWPGAGVRVDALPSPTARPSASACRCCRVARVCWMPCATGDDRKSTSVPDGSSTRTRGIELAVPPVPEACARSSNWAAPTTG